MSSRAKEDSRSHKDRHNRSPRAGEKSKSSPDAHRSGRSRERHKDSHSRDESRRDRSHGGDQGDVRRSRDDRDQSREGDRTHRSREGQELPLERGSRPSGKSPIIPAGDRRESTAKTGSSREVKDSRSRVISKPSKESTIASPGKGKESDVRPKPNAVRTAPSDTGKGVDTNPKSSKAHNVPVDTGKGVDVNPKPSKARTAPADTGKGIDVDPKQVGGSRKSARTSSKTSGKVPSGKRPRSPNSKASSKVKPVAQSYALKVDPYPDISIAPENYSFKHCSIDDIKKKFGLEKFEVKFVECENDVLTLDMIKKYKYDDNHLLTTVGALAAGLRIPLYDAKETNHFFYDVLCGRNTKWSKWRHVSLYTGVLGIKQIKESEG